MIADISVTVSSHLSELYYLSTACPDVDGSVVYQARALYNAIYACAETFETNCAENTAKSLHVNSENSEGIELIRVYPNPNKGEFKILISDPTLQTLNVKITDVSGKTVYSAERNIENQELYVSFNCDSGLYYLEVTNSVMNQSYYEKLLILK